MIATLRQIRRAAGSASMPGRTKGIALSYDAINTFDNRVIPWQAATAHDAPWTALRTLI
jgi:hypothetical protein